MTKIAKNARRGACLGLLLLAATACAEASSPSSSPSPSTSPSTVAGASESPGASIWLAALRIEADPETLDADTADLKDILGGGLIVSPANCFVGLPPEVSGGDYVLGAQAPTEAELTALVEKTGRDPVFEGQVQMLCLD
ncbi:MAG: hypothetical protein ABI635_08990 [Actinomycetota bacterium]